jgi:hypothetical protein
MDTNNMADPGEAVLPLLTDFRRNLQGAPVDARDRMRHTVLNGTLHARGGIRSHRQAWFLPISRRVLLNSVATVALTGIVGGAVAAAGVFAQHTSPSGSHKAAPQAASTEQLRDVAYVKTQTLNALAKASDYVNRSHATYIGGSSGDMWVDAATQRTRYDEYAADGSPVQSTAASGPEGSDSTFSVDYVNRVWWGEKSTASKQPVKPSATHPPSLASDDPAGIRNDLAKGTLQLLGEERVDGIDTLHLRLTAKAANFAMELWVDKATFLPYKRILDKSGKMTATPTETDVYTWLPRTPANLAHLDLTAPAGFSKLGPNTPLPGKGLARHAKEPAAPTPTP